MTQLNVPTAATEAKLSALLREKTGYEISDLDRDATFLELGFDSLFLIQFSMELQKRFGVKVSFRQLIEEISTIDLLVGQLEARQPAADIAPTPSPAEVTSTQINESVAVTPEPREPQVDAQPIERTAVASSQSIQPVSTRTGEPAQVQQPLIAQSVPSQPETVTPILSRVHAPVSAPSATPRPVAAADLNGLEQIIFQQNELMAKHLDLLQSQTFPVAQTTSPVAPTPTTEPLNRSAPQISGPAAEQQAICTSGSVCSAGECSDSTQVPKPSSPTKPNQHERFGPYKPIRKGLNNGLTDQQQQHLSQFIKAYIQRTAKSRLHAETHRDHFADPRGVSSYRRIWKSMVYQIAVEKSQGAHLWDIDGNRYIDIAMGFGLNLFGQSPGFITQALHKQLDRGVEVGPQAPIAGEVAQLLCDFARKDRATFCNTGSEAVMAAMRLARTVTGKTKVVYFNKDYHGNFDQVLVRSTRIGKRDVTSPAAPGVPQSNAETMIVLEYGAPESLQVIRERADEIAAVLIEPVQSANPFLQPKEFLHEIRKITNEHDIAMIMDEVITGFRVAQGGAQEYFDVWGDMSTYGKVLGGGMPIGALAGSSKYMDALDGGTWRFDDDSEPEANMTFFAGTFVRHPLGLAAAHQVLLKVKEEGPELQQELTARTTYLVNTLNAFFERELFPIRVAQFASQFRFMFPPDLEYADMLYFHMIHRGVFTRGWADNCFLCTEHTDDDIEKIIQVVQESCLEIRRGGFFPDAATDAGVQSTAEDQKKKRLTTVQSFNPPVEVSSRIEKSSFNGDQVGESIAATSGVSSSNLLLNSNADENHVNPEQPGFSTLVEIQPKGDLRPIFCVPAADGFTRVYHEMSDHLGENQPVYGIDSPGIYGLPIPDTMEEFAAYVVGEIRAVQSQGPYMVIGFCSGGTVAYEVAQQLIAAGEKVSLLGLIETYNWLDAPSTNPNFWTKFGFKLQQFEFHTRNFLLLNFSEKKQFVSAKLANSAKLKEFKTRCRLLGKWFASGMWFGKKNKNDKPKVKRTMTATNVSMVDLWRKHDDLAEAYVPQPYPGRLIHFRPRRDYKCHLGTELVARDGVEYHRLRAYPAGVMLNPFVAELAELLEKCIDEAVSNDHIRDSSSIGVVQ